MDLRPRVVQHRLLDYLCAHHGGPAWRSIIDISVSSFPPSALADDVFGIDRVLNARMREDVLELEPDTHAHEARSILGDLLGICSRRWLAFNGTADLPYCTGECRLARGLLARM